MLLIYTHVILKFKIAITFSFCFLIQCALYSQTTSIPDVNFEHSLIEMNIDTNGLNGNILNSDASNIITLNIFNRGIYDLTGIEAFSNLKYLYCFQNHINTISVTENTALEVLDIVENKVLTLDLSQNIALKELYISSNLLEGLNVSNNLNLELLSCNLNFINSLDTSQNIELKGLWCYSNNLNSLNLNNNSNLETLFCSENNLSTLDISHNANLSSLSCGNTNLDNLLIDSNTALTYLECSGNNLSELDISNNTLLVRLLCNNNALTELNTTNANQLFLLYTQNNVITSLDFSNNTSLKYIRAENNDLSTLYFRNNQNAIIADFNVTQNPNLTCIYVDDATASYLDNWDIGGNSNFVESSEDCNSLSIHETIIIDFNMFPNPATELVTISLNQNKTNFQLFSMSGKLVLSKQLIYGDNQIHLPNLSSGIYLAKLNSEQLSITKKLIIH